MYHLHLKEIDSTQIYLKEKFNELKIFGQDILISTSKQSAGIGRKGNAWDTFSNAIAMSFTIVPNKVPTLTPLEIGLLVKKYIKEKFRIELRLKWPNDLLTEEGKKCGGILSQYLDSNYVIAGLGLNLGSIHNSTENRNYPTGFASIAPNLELNEVEQKAISLELYQYMLKNRYKNIHDLQNDFNQSCFHQNMKVLLHENDQDIIGFFKGIGPNGEALIEIDASVRSFLSSSLTILN